MAEPLKTHNPVDVAIDEAQRRAKITAQWLLEDVKDKDSGRVTYKAPPKTRGNRLNFLICGEDGFSAIMQDLLEAKATADIVCWGFDPGMELGDLGNHSGAQHWSTLQAKGKSYGDARSGITRKGNTWPRGMCYGDLLEHITTRKENPVTVRLLIWYDEIASRTQNSMPGFTDTHFNWGKMGNNKVSDGPPYDNLARHTYCQKWWNRHLPTFLITPTSPGHEGEVDHQTNPIWKKNPNLQIVLRSIAKPDVEYALSDEEIKPSPHTEGARDTALGISEKSLLEDYPTHHQKPILIDYAYDGGRKAVGYVMGLNSITDFWDTKEHKVDDPLRETWGTKPIGKELEQETKTQGKPTTALYRHTKPYQDYACRVVGPALEGLHKNFVAGWNLFAEACQHPKVAQVPLPPNIPTLGENPAHEVQIVRTQPYEHDKSIKALYYQASSFARNYIYIENQYFFYPAFAQHLKAERTAFCDAWASMSDKPMQEIPTLHMFVVIPHPENDGMVPRTQQTLAELGEGQGMHEQADRGKKKKDKPQPDPLHRPSKQELEKTTGLKISVARLRTSNGLDANNKPAYREIYIHSKLMLIDDVFVTLGSANLNQRSMAVDSEINIAATGQVWAADLRKRVFDLHTNGAVSGSGTRAEIPDVFGDWGTKMAKNSLAMKDGKALDGFLLPFEDHRSTGTMYAQVTIPSAGPATADV